MTSDQEGTETGVALLAGAGLAEPNIIVPGKLATFIVPSGFQVKEIDLEKYGPHPSRKIGVTMLGTVESFIDFVNDHKQAGTTVFANKSSSKFSAVLNGYLDNREAPDCAGCGWCDFVAKYECPLSREWKTWLTSSGKSMNQTQFALFLEDNLPDIQTPDGAVMLEVARTIEARKDVRFKSAIKLSDGSQQFSYDEDVQGTSKDGQMRIPDQFTVAIPVFESGQIYVIDARLRYRIDSGKLAIWYDLVRPEKSVEHAFTTIRDMVIATIEGVKHYDT